MDPTGRPSGTPSHGPASWLANVPEAQAGGAQSLGYYCPDYRTDFPMGDNPYRYYRW